MSEFIVITGLSGAGRSQAANVLEDLGWFVIDNLPPALIDKVTELAQAPGTSIERVALVIGPRAGLEELSVGLTSLRATGARVRIVFLEASDKVLVQRFTDTRRRHPLADGEGIVETIERERTTLAPVKAAADVVVDTTDLNVHQLRERIVALLDLDRTSEAMQTTVLSFGYKHGLPLDADLVIDCRFLPNPHWVEHLRARTGDDPEVRDYVMSFPETTEFLRRLEHLLELVLPAYLQEGKSYLTLALGCTGGRHRSVVIADEVAQRLRRRGFNASLVHRDVER
ncbi:MAG: RNase adapter RapZ [Actinobacteria bacterium]|nr:RNase adapter RapZ [Actinomycetota bacterium]